MENHAPVESDNKYIAIEFGKLIYQARQSLELTQIEAARRADVPQSVLSRVENGSMLPSYSIAGKLAVALGVNLNEFNVRMWGHKINP